MHILKIFLLLTGIFRLENSVSHNPRYPCHLDFFQHWYIFKKSRDLLFAAARPSIYLICECELEHFDFKINYIHTI